MKDLYNRNKRVLRRIYQMREYVNRQDEVSVVGTIQALAGEISELLTYVIEQKEAFFEWGLEVNEAYIFSVVSQMLEAQKAEDYILYGDILQLQMLPIFIDIQNAIRNSGEDYLQTYWEQNMEALKKKDLRLYRQMLECEKLHEKSPYGRDVYSVEDTTVGDLTVAVTSGEHKLYLHSNENPAGFVKPFIDAYYDVYRDDYVIYGLGLCYHCSELAGRDADLHITVIENDIGIIQLAMTYTDMSWYFNHPGVQIIYDADWKEWSRALRDAEDKVVLFHRPSVRRIKDEQVKQKIEKFFVHEGSMRVRSDRMVRNFRFNEKHCELDISKLRQQFQGKTVIVVGAGPSLDKNVHLLKEKPQDCVILAMGAVCRKLYNMGILMDYIIITDPKGITDLQIKGVEESGIPMILLSTATKGVTKTYHGRKFMLCQKGFPDAERLAKENGLMLFETGGSVATTAVDLCIRFQAARIVLVGQDLAFTGNKNHAAGARDEGIAGYEDMLMVEDIDGNLVPTSQPFAMYREWIERRIARADVTMPVIDATEGGARIKGTEIKRLAEVL